MTGIAAGFMQWRCGRTAGAAGSAPKEATFKAMEEVTGAVIAIAFGLCAVFVPTAFLGGITGQFFRQFALTIAVATLLSAFNSLTLSPALCALLLKPHDARRDWFERFTDRTLVVSLREREGYAARLREIDTQVRKIVKALEARGFKSPYLRTFVVARINPVRFIRTKPGDKRPPMPIAAALTRMTAAAKSFDVGKVRSADLALVAALSGE